MDGWIDSFWDRLVICHPQILIYDFLFFFKRGLGRKSFGGASEISERRFSDIWEDNIIQESTD